VETDDLGGPAERLAVSAEALAALGAAMRLRVSGEPAAPEIQACLDEVVDALGMRRALEAASREQLAEALAPIRALFLESVDLLTDPGRAPGWTVTDADLLESQGRSSAAVATELRALAASLPGLADALAAPGARFLDVGVGVAAISIAMCEIWPELHVVGIDPHDTALALARRNVEGVGLGRRIELRRQAVQQLEDVDAFDLAWLAGPFLSRQVLDAGLAAVLRSLRPGGWIVLGLYEGGSDLDGALARLRTARSGGALLSSAEGEGLLTAAGFTDVRAVRPGAGVPAVDVVGRRSA
jgi:precorrin-6B methylase 2